MGVIKGMLVFLGAWVAAWCLIFIAFFVCGHIIFGIEDLAFAIKKSIRKRKQYEREKDIRG